jgi:cytidyltransferase-like protein
VNKKLKTIAVSGGFDPFRLGHKHLLIGASGLGDFLLVILARDDQMVMKKGRAFMPYHERKELLEENRRVCQVVENIDDDLSSCKSLARYQPDIYARGGDRLPKEQWLEYEVCRRFGIQMVDGVGSFDKETNSSDLIGGKHGRELVYYVDVDNTLTFTSTDDYKNAQPNLEEIVKLNKLYDAGHKIIIWTSRGGTSGKNWRDLTVQQLQDWGVRYHEIRMDKPSWDFIVDDKSKRTL